MLTERHLLTNHAGLLATRRVISISMDDIEAVLRPLLVPHNTIPTDKMRTFKYLISR